ncbi:FKBP-type peptidyl-prolyl cis-trans isomerase [Flavobacterium defluvii]|uniref:Peptidyl-prolyl cis-trans isomerase n=1 Tax=Flavobacterium defluvii TaxID=370979 RepID=A0A1M5SE10_9FLAO|nr:FKBP-type peptidyl-prolyl cis-trans isomerase [Flavobacterium defluvii]SHH36518.1 FKBP-type peptidyl-prolyl cis-trans isomerase [Flavobacterium defluvii]
MKQLLSALLALTLFISCSKDKDEVKDYTAQNDKEITEYLAKNNLTAQKTNSGLYYIIEKQGEGDNPVANSNVTVIYKGYFTDGKVFDQSDAEGISFGLNQVIQGWKEGIPFFKPGGEGKLFIPAHLGYGSKDYQSIPGGSVLIFDIKLKSVN